MRFLLFTALVALANAAALLDAGSSASIPGAYIVVMKDMPSDQFQTFLGGLNPIVKSFIQYEYEIGEGFKGFAGSFNKIAMG